MEIFKQPGGRFSENVVESIQNYLTQHKPGWNAYETTFSFPTLPDPKFPGPIGLSSGSAAQIPGLGKTIEEMYAGLVHGYQSEMNVLQFLTNQSNAMQMGWKLFHDLPISQQKLRLIHRLFNGENEISQAFGEGEMCDVLIICKKHIVMVEVKVNCIYQILNTNKPFESFYCTVIMRLGREDYFTNKLKLVIICSDYSYD